MAALPSPEGSPVHSLMRDELQQTLADVSCISEAFHAREAALARREEEVSAREREVTKREAAIALEDEALAKREMEVTVRECEVAQREAAAAAASAPGGGERGALEEGDGAQVVARDRELARREATLASEGEALAKRGKELAQREAAARAQSAAAREREAQLGARELELARREAAVAEREADGERATPTFALAVSPVKLEPEAGAGGMQTLLPSMPTPTRSPVPPLATDLVSGLADSPPRLVRGRPAAAGHHADAARSEGVAAAQPMATAPAAPQVQLVRRRSGPRLGKASELRAMFEKRIAESRHIERPSHGGPSGGCFSARGPRRTAFPPSPCPTSPVATAPAPKIALKDLLRQDAERMSARGP